MPPTKPPPAPKNPIQVKLARDIGRDGWAVLGVMPTAAAPLDPFTYSIGFFRSYDHPELLVSGMPPETAHAVLSILAGRIATGIRYEGGQEYPNLIEGVHGDYACAFRQISKSHIDSKLTAAQRWNAYEDFPALQLVWPDPTGKFPWHDGYDRRFIQPLYTVDAP